jgi:hypothetical protein
VNVVLVAVLMVKSNVLLAEYHVSVTSPVTVAVMRFGEVNPMLMFVLVGDVIVSCAVELVLVNHESIVNCVLLGETT